MTDDEQLALEQWLAIRKEAGLQIDPETAEVRWEYGLAHDPYDVYPNPSEDYDGLGRVYFARSPGSGVWVWFGDLSDETTALWSRHSSKLMFPAGLEQLLNQLGGRDVRMMKKLIMKASASSSAAGRKPKAAKIFAGPARHRT
jgi:hypothetical protein